MIRRKPFFKYGYLTGIFLLIIHHFFSTIMNSFLWAILYCCVLLFPILLRKPKISLGIIVGYLSSLVIFMTLIYIIYHCMVFLAK